MRGCSKHGFASLTPPPACPTRWSGASSHKPYPYPNPNPETHNLNLKLKPDPPQPTEEELEAQEAANQEVLQQQQQQQDALQVDLGDPSHALAVHDQQLAVHEQQVRKTLLSALALSRVQLLPTSAMPVFTLCRTASERRAGFAIPALSAPVSCSHRLRPCVSWLEPVRWRVGVCLAVQALIDHDSWSVLLAADLSRRAEMADGGDTVKTCLLQVHLGSAVDSVTAANMQQLLSEGNLDIVH